MTAQPDTPETAAQTAAPQIHLLAPGDIDANALPRDRTALDPAALAELETSILLTGLRQPIEVWAFSAPEPGGPRYGLISGMRRLTAFGRIHQNDADARIPAFIHQPRDIPDAMAKMIAENEIRADISPWEKGRIVVQSVDEGLFDTLDAAVAGLYPTLDRQRRARFRSIAEVIAEIGEGVLTHPESLGMRQLTRIADALRRDYGHVIEAALKHSLDRSPEGQWKLLRPILDEAEAEVRTPQLAYRPGRPRRVVHPRVGLQIRREKTPEGWNLRFTGPEASGPLMEDIMDYVEQQFGR
ncbi:ParB N-terminal domain-containing protein [Pararhodobacter sp. SW119]|uniref:ParB/RepB/Spo0J family partition protein n=1 Tax=Pararhodobacter sp. SW119 TaxID=2780075 RepID=UPI001AE051BE|nr:ParB N-terminal domain-containing protein [Pararhodobacter sp. SW119]